MVSLSSTLYQPSPDVDNLDLWGSEYFRKNKFQGVRIFEKVHGVKCGRIISSVLKSGAFLLHGVL